MSVTEPETGQSGGPSRIGEPSTPRRSPGWVRRHKALSVLAGLVALGLVALLALARKFIILDASRTEPLTIIGLAAAVLALGAVHWLVRDQDRKDTQASSGSPS